MMSSLLYDMQDTPLILSSKVKIKRGQRQADLLVRNAFVLNYGQIIREPQFHVKMFLQVQLNFASPLRQIAENAGVDGAVVVEKVREMEEGFGFNAATEKYVNMVEAGIIDPAKVTRSAIQNAASVSSLILTTEVLVATKKETKEPEMGNPGMMPGMM